MHSPAGISPNISMNNPWIFHEIHAFREIPPPAPMRGPTPSRPFAAPVLNPYCARRESPDRLPAEPLTPSPEAVSRARHSSAEHATLSENINSDLAHIRLFRTRHAR